MYVITQFVFCASRIASLLCLFVDSSECMFVFSCLFMYDCRNEANHLIRGLQNSKACPQTDFGPIRQIRFTSATIT